MKRHATDKPAMPPRAGILRRALCGTVALFLLPAAAIAQEVSANFGPGAIRVGYDSAACDSGREGAIMFDSGNDIWMYCHNSTWENFTDATDLATLSDVTLSSPQDGEVLVYNSSSGIWENGFSGGGGYIGDMTDVVITSPQHLDVLRYQDGPDHWINARVNLDELQDVSLGTPVNYDYLRYNGSVWENQPYSLAALADTNISAPADTDLLIYYSGAWRNRSNSLPNLTDTTISGSPSNNHVLRYDGSVWRNDVPSSGRLRDLTDTSIGAYPPYASIIMYNGTNWISSTPSTSWALSDLTDVTLTTPQSGNSLMYNGSIWVNTPLALTHLSDVQLDGAASGNTLTYNGSNWEDAGMNLDLFTNVTLSSPANGEALIYTSPGWENTSIQLPNPKLGDMTDVTISAPLENQIFRYSADLAQWVNGIDITGAALPISPYKKFDANTAEPIACDGTSAGALAANQSGKLCACDGTSWKFDDGTACVW